MLQGRNSDACEPGFMVLVTGSKMMANIKIRVMTMVSTGLELAQS
jgi:hypothetical protein